MRRVCAALALVAALVTGWSAARAEVIFQRATGQWTLAAYTKNGSMEFSHCMIDATYKSGARLALWVTYDAIFSMGVFELPSEPARAKLTEIHYRFDAGQPRIAKQLVNRPTDFIAMLPEDETFVNEVRTATLLLIATEAGNFSFKLPGMTQAFDDMLDCVMEQNAAKPRS